ncbi:hypothetical protein L208DRAFT_1377624 [Tricholoma matsutake]|nr:hypothetical protein L208DRAFT_1377624 [Tricholoma matsutake 945]
MSETLPVGTLLVCLRLYFLLTMMGIPVLWKIVQSAEEIVSLTRLTITEGFEANKRGTQSLLVGVDASKHSIWIGQAQAIFNSQELHAQAGKNPELRVLYFCLAHLSKLPVMAVLNMKMDSNMVAIYTAKSISEHPDVSLTEGGMILFALLAGGDYDQLALTRKVPATFPCYHTLFQYVNPDTSWTEDTLPDASHWTPGQLNMTKLASLCELYFTWGMPSGIMANFRGHIYADACIQRLSSPVHMVSRLSTHLSGMIEDGPFTPANVLQIERARSGPGDVPSYHVELSTCLLITALLSGLHGICKEVPENSGPHPLTFVWIPASILHMVLPVLVKQFEVKKPQSSEIGHTKLASASDKMVIDLTGD